ncbi:MAG: hypothetical protein ACFFEY_11660 [Candidatus Thorarchaeota archaeon]
MLRIEIDRNIIISLIKTLKMLKKIIIEHSETFRNYLDIRAMSIMNRILYQEERFKKISNDIKFLMERIISNAEFELYLETYKKMSNDLSITEDSINTQVENAIADFQLYFKDFKEKMTEIDHTLNMVIESLKENN